MTGTDIQVRINKELKRLWGRLVAYLPERQIYFRTDGDTRFLVISSRLQLGLVLGAIVAIGWITVTSANFLLRDTFMAEKEKTIEEMQAAYNKATNDMRDLQLEVIERTRDLEARQKYLESIAEADPSGSLMEQQTAAFGPEPAEEETDELPEEEASRSPFMEPVAMESAGTMSADIFRTSMKARFDALEAAQIRLAMSMAGFASTQLQTLEEQLQETGLKIDDLVRTWDGATRQVAAGGPFIPVPEASPLGAMALSNEPAFLELANRWEALQKSHDSLRSVPSGAPAADYYISSRFGRRLDPLNKISAVHHGLDMAGWPGTEILAAGDGLVTKAGHKGPYGKMIEIDHGNGFKTRYGHLRRIEVNVGERLIRGQTIGEMGCSGRCTSTHLHYEVWFGGKVRNPLPYLKVAQDVYQIQRRTKERYDAIYNNTETSPVSK